jgi:hypothetical protein
MEKHRGPFIPRKQKNVKMIKNGDKMLLVFFTEVWLKRLPDDTAITCEEFLSKSFRIRTSCHVKEVAKMHITT